MTAPAASGFVPGSQNPQSRVLGRKWTLAASLLTHGLFLLAVLVPRSKPIETPAVQSIDVEIISAPQSRPAAATPPSAALTAPPGIEPTRPVPLPAPTPVPKSPAVPAGAITGDGMIHPTHLLARGLLKEAASREVRNTLPKLAPFERATQLCNIETTEQIRAAYPATYPDAVQASSFADTIISNDNHTVTAPGAAYRSKRQWYAVSFICTAAPDYQSVIDYTFRVGPLIPKDQWERHNLIAVDQAE